MLGRWLLWRQLQEQVRRSALRPRRPGPSARRGTRCGSGGEQASLAQGPAGQRRSCRPARIGRPRNGSVAKPEEAKIRLPRYVAVGPHRRNDQRPSDPGVLTAPPDGRFGLPAAVSIMSGLVRSASRSRLSKDIPSGPLGAMKPTMVDANDLPPKRPERLSRLAPSRGYLARISSLQRRDTEPTQHGQC